jgi:hypothetical protein
MYYKGNQTECENYNAKVTLGENYQGSTDSWANVISNQNGQGFAIIKHENYESEMTLIDKIPDSWFNEELNK